MSDTQDSVPMQQATQSHTLSVALEIDTKVVKDIPAAIDGARQIGYDFTLLPLANPEFEGKLDRPADIPWTRSDLIMSSQEWTTLVVGKVSPVIDPDSDKPEIRKLSVKVLKQELMWAMHLSLPAVLLPPASYQCANYANVIYQMLNGIQFASFWLRVPLMKDLPSDKQLKSYANRSATDSWEAWNNFRSMCAHHPGLSVVLELQEDIPSPDVLKKWLGEPVKAVIIPTDIFLQNKKGYPVLPRSHQPFISELFKHRVQFIITGPMLHQKAKECKSMLPYLQYLHALLIKNPPFSANQSIEIPYLDYLQAPLQPLMDNLESQTYEVFEKDNTKYDQYQEAVRQALIDFGAARDKNNDKSKIVIMVVGAGRGPLVRASLRAAVQAKRDVRVYAVEKNPNAVITLQNMKIALNWGDQVTIVDSDMREWKAPELADILVSELLGSFGDNELSPECLDGVQCFLKDTGVSIPCQYISSLSPISSSKLWNEVRNQNNNNPDSFQTSYVVKMHNVDFLDESQDCFEFVHPNHESPIDNNRYKSLAFKVKTATTMHGFAGFFDAKLYKDVHISIDPHTHTPKMFSWFPLYFPLLEPMYVPENGVVEVHFWRHCTRTKVWYEYTVTSPQVSVIHNVKGKSHWIGL